MTRTDLPSWRHLSTLDSNTALHLAAGDPCYGTLTPITTLPPGRWHWEVRDQLHDGHDREYEVRLRRAESVCADDWDWLDPWGAWSDQPHPDARVVHILGVDSGTVSWHLAADPATATAPPAVQDAGRPLNGGRALTTHTGWGDGAYPVAVRHHDGQPTEVRIVYIPADPGPLDPDALLDLLDRTPGLPPDQQVTGLGLTRHWYSWARPDGTSGQQAWDTVTSVAARTADGATVTHHGTWVDYEPAADHGNVEYCPALVEAVGDLWRRLAPGHSGLVATAEAGEPTAGDARGFVTARTDTPVTITFAR